MFKKPLGDHPNPPFVQEGLTLKKIIELNAPTNWPTFCSLKNWHNNLNSVTLQYCKCDFLQGVMVITMETCFNLFIGNVSR